VHREHRGITEGIARVRALDVAVRSADVAVDSARKSVVGGTRTVVDVLNAEQQRMQVLRDLAQARYVTLMATVKLEALAGRVDEGLMARVGAALGP
jgi:outer membrane protein/protease secretion system outer membrane protein